MKIFGTYYCHVTPTLRAVQPGACTGVCSTPPLNGKRCKKQTFFKAVKFSSSSFLMRFEILCFILESHVSGVILEGFGNFICYSQSCWNPKKAGIHVAACKPSRVCSLVLCSKARCWKVLLTLYTCVFCSVSFIWCWHTLNLNTFSACVNECTTTGWVELGQRVQVQKTDSSLRKDSGI